ncbi:multicopper oxidase-domain-containing protein [Delphinella strobiligena]|nr:multicopper oxidase-domain-containing protein [Delphinella strobiligena]
MASAASVGNSTTSPVVTTAPLTTAPVSAGSSLTSSSTGLYTNSTSLVNSTTAAPSTTVFPFAAGGISSGHPLVTNTSACSTAPTSTASCIACAGQPGTDKFCGYTATDNSYDVMPITCNTIEYSLELTECTVSPDGYERPALCVNGQTPGPLITARWGDTVIVHVTNSMSRNGTSFHWHGMRQNHTNEMDGVVSITQCALAPGQSQTYTWKASNYGFSWYHSHLSLQAYEGAFGPMLIDGPMTQTADISAGQLIIQDWNHIPVDDMYIDAEENGPRTLDTGLINGLNVFGDDGSSDQTGSRYSVPTEFESNKTYMFNIVNTAIQSTYKFYIDNHTMTVISADFVPIVPYETDILNINIGQRYQVIVRADQAVGDYWLRFDNQNACATTIQSDNIKGIIHYSGGAGATPDSIAYDYDRKYEGGQILGTCTDEDLSNLVPAYAMDVGAETTEVDKTLIISNANDLNLYRWYLDGTTFQANWGDATLYDIYNNNTVPDYSGNLAISVPDLGEWVYVIIESPIPLGHPIHLHGHDFHILARGYGTYDSSVELNLSNPPRRDVAFLPGDGPTGQGGFLVLAFYTDNPGVWIMHCHIGWHVSMGFALQFVEAQDLIADTVTNSCILNDVCSCWRDWADDNDIDVDDSGV